MIWRFAWIHINSQIGGRKFIFIMSSYPKHHMQQRKRKAPSSDYRKPLFDYNQSLSNVSSSIAKVSKHAFLSGGIYLDNYGKFIQSTLIALSSELEAIEKENNKRRKKFKKTKQENSTEEIMDLSHDEYYCDMCKTNVKRMRPNEPVCLTCWGKRPPCFYNHPHTSKYCYLLKGQENPWVLE